MKNSEERKETAKEVEPSVPPKSEQAKEEKPEKEKEEEKLKESGKEEKKEDNIGKVKEEAESNQTKRYVEFKKAKIGKLELSFPFQITITKKNLGKIHIKLEDLKEIMEKKRASFQYIKSLEDMRKLRMHIHNSVV